ncbi:MAG: hypothetical protein DMD43_01865 [Gemmatimonadetes bacterium]|nr:MAG: hypothetical protein DMD43_01865 [Gemmatimonadota bacterium]
MESGVEFDRFRDRTHALSVPTVLKFGVAHRLQLTVNLPFVAPAGTAFGSGDFAAGLKWRVVDRKGAVGRFAILPSIKIPSGSSTAGRGTGTTDASILLVSSHALGPVAMDLNAGITRRSGDGTEAPRTATVWTASFGYPVKGRLGGVGEIFGYPGTSGPAGSPQIVALLGGPTWQAREWLVFDAGVIVPVTGPQPRAVYVGLTWNAGPYWPGGGGD